MNESMLFIQDLAVIMISAAIGGMVCRRLGLSPILGYLVAGIIVGTPEVVFLYVTDEARVQVLSQIGLVFLMFSIGLGFRLKRIQQLGFPVLLAVMLMVLIVMTVSRSIGGLMGLSEGEALFFAAMLTVSSSVVISKVLQETGFRHQRHGQLALGVTLLEDVVAVVLITFLGSYITLEGPGGDPLLLVGTVGMLGSFVLLLLVLGMLIVPRLLRYFRKSGSLELETIVVAGMLFGLSILAVKAGYSLALGSFLLGVIVAETPRFGRVERAFSGMRDVFATIFFVAIGMTIDVYQLPASWKWILAGTLIALVVRPLAAWLAFVAVCEDGKTAIRTGVSVAPIGEFSFILVGVGIAGGVLSSDFIGIAMGVALMTSLIAPELMKHSDGVADHILRIPMPGLKRSLAIYRDMWRGLGRRAEANLLWKLSRKRIIQIVVEILLVTALLLFARPVHDQFQEPLMDWLGLSEYAVLLLFGLLVGLICMGPLVAVWRNISALAMITGNYVNKLNPNRRWIGEAVSWFMRFSAGILLILWIWNFIPIGVLRGWLTAALFLLLIGAVVIGWRRLIYWHSEMELALQRPFEDHGVTPTPFRPQGEVAPERWGLSVEECILPDGFRHAGRSVGEIGLRGKTGCSVAGIQRQGYTMGTPGPQTHLFPGDLVLLLGTRDQIDRARGILLEEVDEAFDAPSNLHDTVLEAFELATGHRAIGRTLAELNWPRIHGVQVAGVERGGEKILIPHGGFRFQEGDRVLVLGSPARIQEIQEDLSAVET